MRYGREALVALASASALALSACGGDDQTQGSARSEGAAGGTSTTEKGSREEARTGKAGKNLADPGSRTKSRKDSKARRKSAPRTREEALRRLSPKDRAKLVLRFARIVLKAFDFNRASVRVQPGGRIVNVTLAKREACRAHLDEGPRILRALKDSVPYPRTVAVAVAGSSEPLGAYLARNCKRPSLPGGKGRVVFTKSGSNIFETEPFRIRSKRWTIEYVNEGSFFQIFVFKGKEPEREVINRTKPGSGKQTYAGPGTFSLNITGSGDWTVRVRDGG